MKSQLNARIDFDLHDMIRDASAALSTPTDTVSVTQIVEDALEAWLSAQPEFPPRDGPLRTGGPRQETSVRARRVRRVARAQIENARFSDRDCILPT